MKQLPLLNSSARAGACAAFNPQRYFWSAPGSPVVISSYSVLRSGSLTQFLIFLFTRIACCTTHSLWPLHFKWHARRGNAQPSGNAVTHVPLARGVCLRCSENWLKLRWQTNNAQMLAELCTWMKSRHCVQRKRFGVPHKSIWNRSYE